MQQMKLHKNGGPVRQTKNPLRLLASMPRLMSCHIRPLTS
jgi:hypothetical protein